MKVAALTALFFVLFAGEMFGVDFSVATGFSLKNLALYACLLYVAISAAATSSSPASGATLPVALFVLLFCYASISWVMAPGLALTKYPAQDAMIALKSNLLDLFLFFIVYYSMTDSTTNALRILRSVLALVVISNLVTLIDTFNVPDLGLIHQRSDGRVSGPLGESNQYAAFLIFFLPGVVGMALTAKGGVRLMWWTGVLISTSALFLTTSRGAIVGALGGTLLGGLLLRKFFTAKQVIVGGLVVIVLGAAALAVAYWQYGDLLSHRFVTASTTGDLETVSSGRTWIWSQGFSDLSTHPIALVIGFGWNTFLNQVGMDAHSTYLRFAYELGVIGLSLYLFLLAQIFLVIRRGAGCANDRLRPLLVAYLVGYLAMFVALFFVSLYKPWYFIWAYTGVIAKLSVLSCQGRGEVQQGASKRPGVERRAPAQVIQAGG